MHKKRSLEEELYITGLLFLIIGSIGAFLYLKVIVPYVPLFPCVLYEFLGVYCPGCGGTRALEAFFRGEFLLSLWYHPLIVYSMVIYGGFMLTHTLEKLHVPGIKGWKFHVGQIYGAVVVLILNFIIKNVLLLCFHITL